ncbi:hypothetical protein OROMI_000943 [Orobanche minor]
MVDILADLRKQGLQPIPKSPSQVTPTPIVPNKSSCQSGGLDPFINLKGQHRCNLAIMIGTKVVYVAEGTTHTELKLNHHKDVQANHVKVSVDEVFEGYEDKPLPAAQPYVKTIGQAFGTFAMTPKEKGNPRFDSCGHLRSESVIIPKKYFLPKQDMPSLTDKGARLRIILSNFEENKSLDMKFVKSEFCYEEATSIGLTAEHVVQLLDCESISCTIIQVFMLGLMDQYGEKFASNSIGVFCPATIADTSLTKDPRAVEKYMIYAKRQQSSKKCILCPYIQSGTLGASGYLSTKMLCARI